MADYVLDAGISLAQTEPSMVTCWYMRGSGRIARVGGMMISSLPVSGSLSLALLCCTMTYLGQAQHRQGTWQVPVKLQAQP